MKLLSMLILFLLFENGESRKKAKVTVLSFENCKNPDPPLDKDLDKKLREKVESYKDKNGKVMVRGNVTILDYVPGYGMFKAGVIRNNKPFRYLMSYRKMTCKNIIVRLVLRAVKIESNPPHCSAAKGHYSFDNLDVSKIDMAVNFIPAREYGVNVWYFGFYGPHGTYCCYEMRVQIE